MFTESWSRDQLMQKAYCHVNFVLTLRLTHQALILSNPILSYLILCYLILTHFNFLLFNLLLLVYPKLPF